MRVGKSVIFLLPDDLSIPSAYVRALYLKKYVPDKWEFIFLERPKLENFQNKLKKKLVYISNLIKVLKKYSKHKSILYVVKPLSPIEILILRIFINLKVVVDINDPMHLKNFLGNFSKLKFYLIIFFANGVIFESKENHEIWKKYCKNKSCVIEDTPQFLPNDSLAYVERQKKLLWVGSPETSITLVGASDAIKAFQDAGYLIRLMGASHDVIKKLQTNGILVENTFKYSRDQMVKNMKNCSICFIPMPNEDLFNLRGNLKAKLPMSMGSIVVAQKNKMHKRLITNDFSGYLFENDRDIRCILHKLEDKKKNNYIRLNAIKHIKKNYSPASHAERIVNFFELQNTFSKR